MTSREDDRRKKMEADAKKAGKVLAGGILEHIREEYEESEAKKKQLD